MIKPLDVTIIFDITIIPPKPKMMACISPDDGWFYRINTRPRRPAVPLLKVPDHTFLDHDSYLECGDPLELDDYVVEDALRRRGVIGSVHLNCRAAIIEFLKQARMLSPHDKQSIIAILNALP